MRFQLNINLTVEDYIAFNRFAAFETPTGKTSYRRGRLLCILIPLLILTVYVFARGWDTVSAVTVVVCGAVLAIYMLLFKKRWIAAMTKQIHKNLKTGAQRYDPVSSLEFFEDKLVDTTPTERTERSYNTIEHIYVDGDRYIFLFVSSYQAYLLPISQVRAQMDPAELLEFLSQKCGAIEYC